MSAPVVAGEKKKFCVKCGQEVTHQRRMKDGEGHYWCVPCGEADKLRKLHGNAGICAGCGESFNHGQLMDLGGQFLCSRCRQRKFSSGPGAAFRKAVRSVKSLFGR